MIFAILVILNHQTPIKVYKHKEKRNKKISIYMLCVIHRKKLELQTLKSVCPLEKYQSEKN